MQDPTYDDAPDRRMEHIIWLSGGDGTDSPEDECCTERPCAECGAPAGQRCEISCIADQAMPPARPQWADMRRQDIDASEPLTLFDAPPVAACTQPVKPDRYGTPDMFGENGSES